MVSKTYFFLCTTIYLPKSFFFPRVFNLNFFPKQAKKLDLANSLKKMSWGNLSFQNVVFFYSSFRSAERPGAGRVFHSLFLVSFWKAGPKVAKPPVFGSFKSPMLYRYQFGDNNYISSPCFIIVARDRPFLFGISKKERAVLFF